MLVAFLRLKAFLEVGVGQGILCKRELLVALISLRLSFLDACALFGVHSSANEDEVVVSQFLHGLGAQSVFNEYAEQFAVDRLGSSFVVNYHFCVSLQNHLQRCVLLNFLKQLLVVFLLHLAIDQSGGTHNKVDQTPGLKESCNLLEDTHAFTGFAGNLLEGHHAFLALVDVLVKQVHAFLCKRLRFVCNFGLFELGLQTVTHESYCIHNNVADEPDWPHGDKDHGQDELVCL